MFSRLMYAALKAETTENTAVKPNLFFPIMKQSIVTPYDVKPSTPILFDRSMNINPIKDQIGAPSGSIAFQIEPKTFGHFLKGVFGAVLSGVYFPITAANGAFTVGETVTGGSSGATGVVVAYSNEADYLLISTIVGSFTIGETLTGGSSGHTATLGTYDVSVFGHEFKGPTNSLPTYTLEIGYQNEAYRFTGVRFNEFKAIAHADNIITADVNVFARAEFKLARVTAITASGNGSKNISVDQTLGLVTSDTIKLFRPSTGQFLDFVSNGVKTHTINSMVAETTINVTNLQTSTAVGDLIVIAPQTPSYALSREFPWIGGSIGRIGSTITAAIGSAAANIEKFDLMIQNEMEAHHAAVGTTMASRFPINNFLKKFDGSGKINRAYVDMSWLDIMRNSTPTGLQIQSTGAQINATALNYMLDWRTARTVWKGYNPAMDKDTVIMEDVSFTNFRSTTDGYVSKALLVTDITTF